TNFLHVPHHTITTRLSINLFRSTLHYAQNIFSIYIIHVGGLRRPLPFSALNCFIPL
ncbi:unnamed protein product, partial [Prunus brigantina]